MLQRSMKAILPPEANSQSQPDTDIRPNIKVLFMSGFTDETIGKHGLNLEHSDFLAKPFTVGVLAKKMRDKLDSD